ncbi:MAG: aldehyde dehydrogenase family protein [Eubacteriales bacterium]
MSSNESIRESMWIDGALRDAADGAVLHVVNPATNEAFATVPAATEADVLAAIDAADRAFSGWSRTTPFTRGALLRRAYEAVLADAEEIARLMTLEQGKPLAEAHGEVKKGAEILRYYAEEGERVYGRIVPNAEGINIESRVIYQPIGPVGLLSPWNYPVELMAWKVGAALAAGCTFVLKVPSETPLSPLAFVRAMRRAGFPEGVVNVITGRGSAIGRVLTGSDKLKKIAFTGSTAVGRTILAQSVESLRHLSLELGGSLPMVVTKNADLEAAAVGAARRSFRNMGQICIAVNRIYVERCVYEPFLQKFSEKTARLRVGNGISDTCDLGPMCTKSGLETAKKHIADALERGARCVIGGAAPQGERFEKGNFFNPTILADCTLRHARDAGGNLRRSLVLCRSIL